MVLFSQIFHLHLPISQNVVFGYLHKYSLTFFTVKGQVYCMVESFLRLFSQTSECSINFGCFRRPQNCTGQDCEFLITYKAVENMPEYVDITMTTTSQWIALGHNGQRFMVKDTTFRYYLREVVPKNSNYNRYCVCYCILR